MVALWTSSSSPSFLLNANPAARRTSYPAHLRVHHDEAHYQSARAVLQQLPGYAPTQLHSLDTLATRFGVAGVFAKDESTRFGLGAFKSVGGAYAVAQLLERMAEPPDQLTLACASAGNHGRAVAWAARTFGARCVVYLYRGVSPGRARAIAELRANVVMTPATYDDALVQVADDAERNGWLVVSDTGYPGNEDTPRDVMTGYSVIAQEALEQIGAPPTHVMLQAGVGSFAAAMAQHIWLRSGDARPTFIIVEPERAACVAASLRAGQPVTLPEVDTIMGGLGCAEISSTAWPVLHEAADFTISIPDDVVAPTMRALYDGAPRIIAGESGIAGIAALERIANDPAMREQVGLDQQSRVLVFITEGATDPERWSQLTGRELSA